MNRGTRLFLSVFIFLLRRVCLLSEKSINEIFKDKKDVKMFTGPHGRGSLYSLLLMLLLTNYQ